MAATTYDGAFSSTSRAQDQPRVAWGKRPDPSDDWIAEMLEKAAVGLKRGGVLGQTIVGTASLAKIGWDFWQMHNGHMSAGELAGDARSLFFANAMSALFKKATTTLAIHLEGLAAQRTFNAHQEKAKLQREVSSVKPFRDPSLPDTAVAKMIDPRRGIYLVREHGAAEFTVMTREKFERLQERLQRTNAPLAIVTVSDGSKGQAQLKVEQYVGGKLHGYGFDAPAVVTVTDGKAEARWFHNGTDITDKVNAAARMANAARQANASPWGQAKQHPFAKSSAEDAEEDEAEVDDGWRP